MPFDNTGTYTPAAGAESAAPGQTIRSATWNNIFTDLSSALTDIGQGVAIEFVMRDAASSPIATGIKGYLEIPMALTILSWKIMADQAGSFQLDIWKAPFASFPPVIGNSITGSAKPILTSAISSSSSVLTGWTTSIDKGDILAFNVVSNVTCQQITFSMDCGRA